jgi:peptidoglycan/xylan/chitin deacetylase (PgdA/CDA1 family)
METKKILTFSYDDGVTQDERLAELFRKYGMAATFNVNSELLGNPGELVIKGKTVSHNKLTPADARRVYRGFEVAAHTLTHPPLMRQTDEEVVRQVEEDRLRLSDMMGYEVVGFAYPGGRPNYDERVARLVRERTGVKYARTINSSLSFDRQENLIEFRPTVYHYGEWDRMFELGREFLALPPETDAVFYVWGHAYEFDLGENWDKFEEFLAMMAGKEDIRYLTNREALLGEGF